MPEEVWLAAFRHEVWSAQQAKLAAQRLGRKFARELIIDIAVFAFLVGLVVWVRV